MKEKPFGSLRVQEEDGCLILGWFLEDQTVGPSLDEPQAAAPVIRPL